MCIDWFAPGYKAGGPISSCVNFVKGLEDVFDLYVLTTDTDLGSVNPYPNVQSNEWLPFGNNSSVLYLAKEQRSIASIRHHIKAIAPDFLYLNSLFSVYFTIIPLLLYKLNQIHANIILAPRGMLRESALQYKSYKKRLFLSLVKWLNLYSGVRFHATDEQEWKDIQTILPQVQSVHLIANLPKSTNASLSHLNKQEQRIRCIFIGRIHPIKNLLFFLKVLQQVQHFQVDFSIIGNMEDEAYWQECQVLINKMPSNVSIQYLGGIPAAEIETYLMQHHLMVLPTLGENFGHAIFESFLAGRPVMISDQTPWRNLQLQKAGFDLSLQEPQQWLDALATAAQMSQASFEEWVAGARCFAKQYLDQSQSKQKYIALFS